jgi:hypothetical protein
MSLSVSPTVSHTNLLWGEQIVVVWTSHEHLKKKEKRREGGKRRRQG